MNTPFNIPYVTGKEEEELARAISATSLSADGLHTHMCEDFLGSELAYTNPILTTSCTDALELSALLLNVSSEDEVILPSYCYVSTANAFALRGANLVFGDSGPDHPNISFEEIVRLTTSKTKAILLVHYGGSACDLAQILPFAKSRGIIVIEDAAHCIGVNYNGRPLGSHGSLGVLSFHQSKNIHCGEGGCLLVNDELILEQARIISRNGTNKYAFNQNKVKKYDWISLGSNYALSSLASAFLYVQLAAIREVTRARIEIWERYHTLLEPLHHQGKIQIPSKQTIGNHNGHIFYLICQDMKQRDALIAELKLKNITAVFHYLPLHSSPYFSVKYSGEPLPNARMFGDCLLRLPMYYGLSIEEQDRVVQSVSDFFNK